MIPGYTEAVVAQLGRDAGHSGVAFLFRINVALLVGLEIAGLWGAACLIRSAWRRRKEGKSTQQVSGQRNGRWLGA